LCKKNKINRKTRETTMKYIVPMATLALFFSHTHAMKNIKNTKELTIVDSIGIGATTGMIAITGLQPLLKIKNDVIQQKMISWHPAVLYRGFLVSFLSMTPTTIVQVTTNDLLKKTMPKNNNSLSALDKTAIAFLAGVSSALAVCPAERVMIKQQNGGEPFKKVISDLIKRAGFKTLYHGFIPTAGREGTFATSYLASDVIAQKFGMVNPKNELLYSLSGSLPAAILGANVSLPCDVIKTNMQSHELSLKQAVKKIYHADGLRGFMRGSLPRTSIFLFGIPVMSYTSKVLEQKVKNMNH